MEEGGREEAGEEAEEERKSRGGREERHGAEHILRHGFLLGMDRNGFFGTDLFGQRNGTAFVERIYSGNGTERNGSDAERNGTDLFGTEPFPERNGTNRNGTSLR